MKQRDPQTYSGAITRIAGHFTFEGLAEIVKKSAGLVYKWTDPDNTESLPTIKQAEEMDCAYVEATGEDPPIGLIYAKAIEEAQTKAPVHQLGDPFDRMAMAVKEVTEACQAYHDLKAHDGDKPSQNMIVWARKQIAEAKDVLTLVERDIEAVAGNVVNLDPAS